jgi:hypothetical protein
MRSAMSKPCVTRFTVISSWLLAFFNPLFFNSCTSSAAVSDLANSASILLLTDMISMQV